MGSVVGAGTVCAGWSPGHRPRPGEPRSLEKTLPRSHHAAGLDAKARGAENQNRSDLGELNGHPLHPSPLHGEMHLCFLFLKPNRAFIIHLFPTKKLTMFTSKFGKRTKKIESTHFILQRETLTHFTECHQTEYAVLYWTNLKTFYKSLRM